MKSNVTVMTLGPNARLDQIRKEWHSRRETLYVVQDKLGNYLFIAQSLLPMVEYINEHIAESSYERVSLPSFYHMCGRKNDRVGGYTKARWRIDKVPLNGASDVIETTRACGYQTTLILGQPDCYKMLLRP